MQIIDLYPDLNGLSLVLEFMPESLYDRIKNENYPLSRQQVRKYSSMMLKGIDYLHNKDIIHRVSSCVVISNHLNC